MLLPLLGLLFEDAGPPTQADTSHLEVDRDEGQPRRRECRGNLRIALVEICASYIHGYQSDLQQFLDQNELRSIQRFGYFEKTVALGSLDPAKRIRACYRSQRTLK